MDWNKGSQTPLLFQKQSYVFFDLQGLSQVGQQQWSCAGGAALPMMLFKQAHVRQAVSRLGITAHHCHRGLAGLCSLSHLSDAERWRAGYKWCKCSWMDALHCDTGCHSDSQGVENVIPCCRSWVSAVWGDFCCTEWILTDKMNCRDVSWGESSKHGQG